MVCIRQATMEDLLSMQRCNLLCLPENYQLKVRRRQKKKEIELTFFFSSGSKATHTKKLNPPKNSKKKHT